MWTLRALANLLLHLAVGVALALLVAVLWALARGGSFVDSFRVACYVVGAVMFLLAAGGQQRSYGVLETSGRLPGMPAWMTPREADRSLSVAGASC
jgi:cytochrome c oxidase assembly factor CtaG